MSTANQRLIDIARRRMTLAREQQARAKSRAKIESELASSALSIFLDDLFAENVDIRTPPRNSHEFQRLLRPRTSDKDVFILNSTRLRSAKERNRSLSGFFSKTRVLLRCAYASRSIRYAVHLPEPVEIDDLHGSLD